jgi:hypothetical protein
MTDPVSSIRKLLWLADHGGSLAERSLAEERVNELAKRHKIDLAKLAEAVPGVDALSGRYDWFSGRWVNLAKW